MIFFYHLRDAFVFQSVHKMSACPKVVDISKRKPGIIDFLLAVINLVL